MVNPLEELIRQNNEFHDSLIEQNNELDRAFQSGAFGQLVQSWSGNHGGGGISKAKDVAGEVSPEVLECENRGTSGESETDGKTI